MKAADGTPIAEDLQEYYRQAKGLAVVSANLATELIERTSAAEERERVLREALEEAENKLRAHDGLVALRNGIPETTGDAVFDEVLRVYPVAEMLQRGWLGSATGFDDLPFLRKSLLRFFEASGLEDLLDPDFFKKQFFGRPRLCVVTPAPEQPKEAS